MMEIKRRGGSRPGAGRKMGGGKRTEVGRLSQSDAWFNDQIEHDNENIPRWMKFYRNLERLSDGIFKTDEADETKRIYWIAPDRAANQYLLDRHFGKPVETTEHSGKNGEPISISIVSYANNGSLPLQPQAIPASDSPSDR